MSRLTFCLFVFIAVLFPLFTHKTEMEYRVLSYAVDLLEETELHPVDRSTRVKDLMTALSISSPDFPYTHYSSFEEEEEFIQEQKGVYVGIGACLLGCYSSDSGGVWAVPFPDSSASNAGLRFGDRIVAVNGVSLKGKSLKEISNLLRGEVNSTFRLTIRSRESLLLDSDSSWFGSAYDESQPTEDLLVVRSLCRQSIVSGDRVNSKGEWIYTLENAPSVGYIQIDRFSLSVSQTVGKILEDLEGSIESLIIDLRGNPGGDLFEAIAFCSLFLDEGTLIATVRNRDNKVVREYRATSGKKFREPLVILIDEESASAAELTSAALSDYKRAYLIGNRSYGKGTVQRPFLLPFQMGMLRITAYTYWRPSEKPIHRFKDAKPEDAWGVLPDQIVTPSEDEKYSARYLRAIRRLQDYEENRDFFQTLLQIRLKEIKKEDSPKSSRSLSPSMKRVKDFLAKDFSTLSSIGLKKNPSVSQRQDQNDPSLKEESSGTAPYGDPVLDRAIAYLNEQSRNQQETSGDEESR